MTTRSMLALLAVIAVLFAAFETGLATKLVAYVSPPASNTAAKPEGAPPPAVSAIAVREQDFVETVLVTGSLVAREEILVAPEVDGLRVTELRVDEGDRVKKGDILAVLVSEQLDAQLAQNDANLARAEASIARAKSSIAEQEARVKEAEANLERARPLVKSKFMSESVFDQREALAKAAAAQLVSARDGLKVAEAEQAQVAAQRRELTWRRDNTRITAPADGLISKRGARIGSIALGATIAGTGEPMFRIIEKGEIELDAEVPEVRLPAIRTGQTATIEVAGAGEFEGRVRLVAPEVDKAARVGRVRIFIGDKPNLHVGAFARGSIETARARNLAIPRSAVLYDDRKALVQVIENGKVATRQIETGLSAGGEIEVRSGLRNGDLIVARAGTFLRDGDAVRPVLIEQRTSEAQQ